MPNYCSNYLTLTHEDPAMIVRAKDALERGEFLAEFIPVPEELQIVAGSVGNPVEQAKLEADTNRNIEKYGYGNWYDYCVNEWGTKWDVAVSEDNKYPDTTIEEAENGENYVVHYNFNTAWSRPLGAISKLSAQYPNLLFTLSYEEETGWGGEMEFLRGEVISESEYDNMCRDCDATDQMEYCDNDCGEICGNCNWLGNADLEAVAICQTHKIYLDTKVPEYRKVEA